MSALPAELSTGMVHGRFIVAMIDGDDTDQEPDVIPASGKIVFKASVPYVPVPVTSEGPVTVLKGPITGVLDSEGYLCTPHPMTSEPMYRGVKLLATDDPDMAVTDWTWTAEYRLDSVGAVALAIAAHSFALPSGSELDLTTLVKVPSSPGYGLPQAEAAVNETITGATVVGDDLQMTRRNGGTFIAGNVRGAQGVQGIQGVQGPAGISNADQFYTVSETAGRTVTIWDYLNNREQLIYGDTGWKTATLINGWTGTVQYRRELNRVTVKFRNMVGTAASSTSFINLPLGYRSLVLRLPVQIGATAYYVGFNSSGDVFIPINVPTDSYWSEVSYTTDNVWPVA